MYLEKPVFLMPKIRRYSHYFSDCRDGLLASVSTNGPLCAESVGPYMVCIRQDLYAMLGSGYGFCACGLGVIITIQLELCHACDAVRVQQVCVFWARNGQFLDFEGMPPPQVDVVRSM